jgi:putative addiction module component (TIGR02574 family)
MPVQSDIKARALDLPAEQRAELARELILSLENQEPDPNTAAAWEAEIEQRASAVDRGEVTPVDWRESVERIRNSLRRRDRQ